MSCSVVPSMAPPICSWSFLSSPETAPPGPKSFAQAVSAAGEDSLPSLPPKVIAGDTVRIRITQREYEAELSECLATSMVASHIKRGTLLCQRKSWSRNWKVCGQIWNPRLSLRLAGVSSSSIFTQWKRWRRSGRWVLFSWSLGSCVSIAGLKTSILTIKHNLTLYCG